MRLPGGPPRAISGEILRTRLIDRLAARWDVPVTTVVAGPGFGKSTALAQAMRRHAADPRGVEAWVTCEPGDEDARRLATAVCRAFGVPAPAVTPLDAALEALRSASPIETCLILDDCHEIPAGSSGERLIADLVRHLPAGAHLLLSGRRLPAAPLARLHAAELIRCFHQADLAFDEGELAQAAGHADRAAADVAGLGGWPALVRLTLAAPPGVARDYLWEEVVSGLSPADREALLYLAMLGSADASDLLDRVPLVARFGDGRIRAHHLWTDALTRLLPAAQVASVRAHAAGLLLDRGDALRAGSIAIEAGDVDLLDRAATVLVASTLATFPQDTGVRWLAAVAETEHGRPGLRLLTAATRYASRAGDREVDGIVDAAFRDGDARLRTAALSLATIAAHARGDENRLAELFQESLDLPGADAEPTLRLLMAGVRGAIFELMGSIDDALALVEALPPDDVDHQPGKIIVRFHVYLLLLAGRADEAAVIAQKHLSTSPYAHVRRMPQFARWLAGDPRDLLPAAHSPDRPAHLPEPDANDRYRFNFLAFATVVAASLGDRPALEHSWSQLAAGDLGHSWSPLVGGGLGYSGSPLAPGGLGGDTRDAAMLATAAAARAILNGDEEQARAMFAAFVGEHPLSDPVAAVHLRRFLGYGYVLSPPARRTWDSTPLGPAHQRVREVARLLLAARAGRLTSVPMAGVTPETVLIALPLPWAVELAAHAAGAGLPFGRRLFQWLVDHLGSRAHDALRPLAGRISGARRLLDAVPITPSAATVVSVLGPLRVLVDGRPVELRRRRVRQLLTILAVTGEIDRDRLMDLLWPDLDPAAAARNLRVTLTYLRQALGADHLRCDRSWVRLVRSKALTVDLADLRDHLAEADAARSRGDPAATGPALAAAVGLWRGDPLTDLVGFDGVAAGVLAELTEAALTLGERRFAEGDTTAAAELARRALAAEPYAERGMRLLLAAETQRRDPVALGRVVCRVREALNTLGAPPEPATRIVLRQAELAGARR
ncbi:putative SARP-family transcriptional regulator [Actinoplanes missouriensis 431]|uniref:Putative SARP-family transcriptional regulator n=1 Tax=Actinoplanes missouriensis (strain ATCC 14538 / DSM 43046 / CBS 188.64 / JCM 3121 / NBRC 102363 / NCIMB 12654 / NRRL B-3342 / UNCC 431) TaxID=512565 RepID=I0HDN2_ACTM4|nr:BTAD domain-containing putative transcriptional regulator [Actinoplanes missouriensis]BAL91119.1 putative SARP-family transcriptional regulator [Actinoplanes missouriensis 431]